MDIDFNSLEKACKSAKDVTEPTVKPTKRSSKEDSLLVEAIRNTPRLKDNIALPAEVTKVEHVSVKGAVIQGNSKTSLLLLIKKRQKQKDNDLR